MSTGDAGGAGVTSAEEFFRFFQIEPPAGLTPDGADRFIRAYLRDEQRRLRWEAHLASRGVPLQAAGDAAAIEPLRFTGSGGEYFRIWIVNLLLTILTLGIYSAWAKVRRLQYFYRHTQLAGSGFEYDGSPWAILKGRVFALGLLLAYQFSFEASMTVGFATLALLAVALPWLLRNSFRFRLRHSSYRGVRFRFTRGLGESYLMFLLRPLLVLLSFYLAAPWFHQRLKRYQHAGSAFGQTPFDFRASVGQFYQAYLLPALLVVAVGVVGFAAIADVIRSAAQAQQGGAPLDPDQVLGGFLLAFVAVFAGGLALTAMLQARVQNVVWGNTSLGPHRFLSSASAWKMMQIHITNVVGIVLTLGLFAPWAAVRLARYRADTMALEVQGGLDALVAASAQDAGALGEETAEMFDLDIGL